MSQREETVTFVISVAADLAGMHPQTLRQYDRLGLVIPARTKGRGRRYTKRDVQRLREVQRMSQEEGINLAGIRRILDLENRIEVLEAERDALRVRVEAAEERNNRVFAASRFGEVQSLRRGQRIAEATPAPSGGEVTVWNPLVALAAARAAGMFPRRSVRALIEQGR